jgi:hypothetical protein
MLTQGQRPHPTRMAVVMPALPWVIRVPLLLAQSQAVAAVVVAGVLTAVVVAGVLTAVVVFLWTRPREALVGHGPRPLPCSY